MRWFRWFGRNHDRDRELNEELETHFALEVQQRIEAGQMPEDAQFGARRDFGNFGLVKEVTRQMWGWNWIDRFFSDIWFAGRGLRKAPGFTAVSVITLALGIGANTAIFSVVDAVLLRPLPFTNPDRLVQIYSTKNGAPHGGPSPLDLRDFARGNHTFDRMVVFDAWRKNVGDILGSNAPEQMRIGLVLAEYFSLLGIHPVIGRLFSEEENDYGRHRVVAIGESFWKNRLAGIQSILGQTIRINDEPYTIVAVMPDAIPDWMAYPKIEIWTPFAVSFTVWTPICLWQKCKPSNNILPSRPPTNGSSRCC